MDETPNQTNETTNLSRRELLKALAASGGALAVAAFMPSKWTKPVVQSGVLPVHAQATLCPYELTIDDYGYNDNLGQWVFYVLWTPCSDDQPSAVRVWIGSLQATLNDVTYNMVDSQYCGAQISATRDPASVGFDTTIQVWFGRTCYAEDTIQIQPPG